MLNGIFNGCKTVITTIFPLIMYPYITRILGVESLGEFNFSNSITNYFVLIAGLGISTYAGREGASLRDDKDKVTEFGNDIFSINILSAFSTYILFIIFILLSPALNEYRYLLIIQSLMIIGNTIGVSWIFTIYENYIYITLRTLCVQLISLVLIFSFVKSKKDLWIYAVITVVSSVGPSLFSWFYANKNLSKIRFTIHFHIKKHIKSILYIFSSSVATTIYVSCDTTMLGAYWGNYLVGIYSVSVKIYTIFKSVITAAIIVTLPRLSNYIGSEEYEKYKNTVNSLFKGISVLLFPFTIGIYMLSDNAIYFVAGNSYMTANSSFRILCIAQVFAVFGVFYTNAVLLPLKKEKIITLSTCVSAILNLGLNFVAIPYWKESGAAVTTVISEFTVLLIQIIYAKKYINFKIKLCDCFSILTGCTVIYFYIKIILIIVSNTIVQTVLSVAGSIFIYFFVLIMLKNSVILSFCKKYPQDSRR